MEDGEDLHTASLQPEREESLSDVSGGLPPKPRQTSTAASEPSSEAAKGDDVWRLFAGIVCRLRQLEDQPKPFDGARLLADLEAAAEDNRRETDNKLFYKLTRLNTLTGSCRGVITNEKKEKELG